MNTIECTAFLGGTKRVAVEKLMLRPAAYAILIHDGEVLLMNTRSTGKLSLPGGGVEVGERLEEALRREVLEETGLEIEVGRLAGFKEDFFYYDPLDNAFHSLLFFFVCWPRTFDLLPDELIDDEEVERPRWMRGAAVQEASLQSHGDLILSIMAEEGLV